MSETDAGTATDTAAPQPQDVDASNDTDAVELPPETPSTTDAEAARLLPKQLDPAAAEELRRKAFEGATKLKPTTSTPPGTPTERKADEKAAGKGDDKETDAASGKVAEGRKLKPASATVDERAQIVRADNALKRAGIEDETIARLTAAEKIAIGTRLAQTQRSEDEIRRRLGQLEARLKQSSGGVSSSRQAEPQDRDRLDEWIDETLAENAKDSASQTDDRIPDKAEPKTTDAAAQYESRLLRTHVTAAMDRIKDRFPQIDFDDTVTKAALAAQMQQLDPDARIGLESIESAQGILEKAIFIEFGKQLTQHASVQRRAEVQAARSGQPSLASSPTNGKNPRGEVKRDPESIRQRAFQQAISKHGRRPT